MREIVLVTSDEILAITDMVPTYWPQFQTAQNKNPE